MEWQIVLAFVIVVSIIIFTGAFVLYLNIGGGYIAINEARASRLSGRRKAEKLEKN